MILHTLGPEVPVPHINDAMILHTLQFQITNICTIVLHLTNQLPLASCHANHKEQFYFLMQFY